MRIRSSISRIIVLVALLAAVISSAASAAIPSRPFPQRLVNDFAGIFSAREVRKLESMLVAFDDSTTNQITVVTVSDLGGMDPNQYAAELGIKWGVGGKKNNGVVLLVKPKTSSGKGQVSIQVGYGLEGAIPDVYASRIINQEIIPHFKNGDYYGGVRAGCEKLMALASGEISEIREKTEVDFDFYVKIFSVLLFIFFFILFSRHAGNGGSGGGGDKVSIGNSLFAALLLSSLSNRSSSRGGSSWGGGGGFGGFGGGSFGGGGASGSW